MTVVVVGAGLAGVACGVELAAAGVDVRILERARTVGGRMASRRIDGRPVDLGAAYFTVSDPAFAQVVVKPEGATGVVVGHDMRPSSPSLSRAFADGVASQGVDVTLIGLCSTDGLYYASGALDLPGAISVTAGLTVLVYAIVKAESNGWGSATTITLAAVAFALGNCTVVTKDSDLAAVPGLAVEVWSVP